MLDYARLDAVTFGVIVVVVGGVIGGVLAVGTYLLTKRKKR